MLLIEGPKFSGFDFTPGDSSAYEAPGEPFYINNRRILLASKQDLLEPRGDGEQLEDEPLSHTSKTAKSVWDCVGLPCAKSVYLLFFEFRMAEPALSSIVMSKYLEALSLKRTGFWSDKRLIELGAGQGLSSFSAAALGAEVIITDVDTAVPSLRQGAQLNGLSEPQVRIRALDWMNCTQEVQDVLGSLRPSQDTSTKLLDYILASDVIWVDFLIAPLVNTIAQLMQVSKERRDSLLDEDDTRAEEVSTPPVLILAHQSRSARCDNMFFDSLDALGLQRKKIRLDGQDADEDSVDLDPKYRKSNLAIWKVWRE
ncbi:hypothetical protein BGZ82_005192 [Podila clonocystis]|nr:hypothetical protein BGZ82_005192 [Podila clonocystis]